MPPFEITLSPTDRASCTDQGDSSGRTAGDKSGTCRQRTIEVEWSKRRTGCRDPSSAILAASQQHVPSSSTSARPGPESVSQQHVISTLATAPPSSPRWALLSLHHPTPTDHPDANRSSVSTARHVATSLVAQNAPSSPVPTDLAGGLTSFRLLVHRRHRCGGSRLPVYRCYRCGSFDSHSPLRRCGSFRLPYPSPPRDEEAFDSPSHHRRPALLQPGPHRPG